MNRTATTRESEEFQELLDQFDLELWLDDAGVDYRLTSGRSGEQINIKTCPRCAGSSWKVYLNRDNGLGNCFHGSCVGEPGFNKFTFVKCESGEDNRVVSEIIKEQLRQGGWRPKTKKSVAVEIPDNIDIPESTLITTKSPNEYLEKRGFDYQTIERFHLRYCTKGFYEYTDLIEQKKKWQAYSGRIIIPVFDATGKLTTFQGRDTTNTQPKKYLFPPMLPSTGKYLYNIHNCLGKKHLILGEGVFDVMALDQIISKEPVLKEFGAIGSFGISLGMSAQDQLGQIKHMIAHENLQSLTFMWDGSKQAIKQAFLNAIELTTRCDIDIKVAILPNDKDPNEVAPEVVLEAIAKSIKATKLNYMRAMATLR